jgi:hypothetical protein
MAIACLCPIGMLHMIYMIIRIYMTFRAKPVQRLVREA